MQLYSEDHSISITNESLISAKEVVPFIMELLQPRKVIDVGCGLGAWLSVFKDYGVEEIIGIDGDYVDLERLKIPQAAFRAHDLTKPIEIELDFDLVISLEVAEHLPIQNAEIFVDSLVNLAPTVLFSAAPPDQPGVCHINCQWPAYWANLFDKRGYVVFDCLRMKFWQNTNVNWWYSQNMLLFVDRASLQNYANLIHNFESADLPPPSIIHPSLYLMNRSPTNCDLDDLSFGRLLSMLRAKLIQNLKQSIKTKHKTIE